MDLCLDEWLPAIEGEYLRDFVPAGGAAVKFAVASSPTAGTATRRALERTALAADCQVAIVDAAATKIHMIDHLFHAVARQIDWDALAHRVVRDLLQRQGFRVPDGEPFDYRAIADFNSYDEGELRRDVRLLLTTHVFRDFAMAQEFRIAMVGLCQAQLDPGESIQEEATAIRAWLRGELRLISALKPALIFQKVARHNARDMFLSLAHWLWLTGKQGLVLVLDVSRYTLDRREPDGTLYHTTAAAMDAYEVLRQFIDATDEFESSLIAVIAQPAFLEDAKRGLQRYDPLKLRIWAEVHDRRRANPLSALIRLRADDVVPEMSDG